MIQDIIGILYTTLCGRECDEKQTPKNKEVYWKMKLRKIIGCI